MTGLKGSFQLENKIKSNNVQLQAIFEPKAKSCTFATIKLQF